MGSTSNSHNDSGRSIGAVVLIALGLIFLFSQVFNFSLFGLLWPFFVILPGLAFLVPALRGGKKEAGLAVPGAIITGTGGILLYQSLTGHWASWAYVWLLYPVFLGLALRFMGERTGDRGTADTGSGFIRWGGTAFLVVAALFELMIFRGGLFGSMTFPLLLIGLGALMLYRRPAQRAVRLEKSKHEAPIVTGARLVKSDLQRRIDEALAEAEDEDMPQEKPKNEG